jgi:hypothetical protein
MILFFNFFDAPQRIALASLAASLIILAQRLLRWSVR